MRDRALDINGTVLDRIDLMRSHAKVCPRVHPVRNIAPSTIEHFTELLSHIKYKDWEFKLRLFDGMLMFQVLCKVDDVSTGKPFENYGPPYPLCPDFDDDSFVDFVFRAVLQQEMHETAEYFVFKGMRVYYPHDPSGQP